MADLPMIDLDDDDGGTGGGGFNSGWHHAPDRRAKHEALIAHLPSEEQELYRKGLRPFPGTLKPPLKP